MTALGVIYQPETTEQSVAGSVAVATSDVDSVIFTVDGTNFATGDYLIICTSNLGTSSSSFYAHAAVYQDTTLVTGSDCAIDPSTSTATKGKPYFFMGKITQGGTPDDITFRIAPSDSSATANAGMIYFLAIPLDDLNADDFRFDDDTTSAADTTSYVSRAAITLPSAGGDDWFVIGYDQHQIDATTTTTSIELSDGTDNVEAIFEGRDSAEVLPTLLSRTYESVASSETFSVSHKGAGTSNDHLYSSLFALRLGAFTFSDSTYTDAASSALGSAYTTVDTTTFTPSEAGDHLVWHTGIWDVPDSDDWIHGKLVADAITVAYDDGRAIQKSKDTADERPLLMFAVPSLDGLSQTAYAQYDDDNSTGGTVKSRQLLVLSWELAAAGAPSSVVSFFGQVLASQ